MLPERQRRGGTHSKSSQLFPESGHNCDNSAPTPHTLWNLSQFVPESGNNYDKFRRGDSGRRRVRQNRAMAPTVTNRELWLGTIRTEGDRLASMPPEALDAPVPSIPGWTVERVVRHVGKVHRWVNGLLTAPVDADPDAVAVAAPSLPRGPDCLPAYRDALDAVVAELEAADPGRATASFLGPTQVRFWIRRQAHEVSVHRVDAADAVHAAGGPPPEPLDPTAACDGVGEWAEVFVGTRHRQTGGTIDPVLAGHTIGLVATDVAPTVTGQWMLSFDSGDQAPSPRSNGDGQTLAAGTDPWAPPGRQRTDPSPATASVTLSASAGPLLLTLWRRRPIDTVEIAGDRSLAATLLDTMRF